MDGIPLDCKGEVMKDTRPKGEESLAAPLEKDQLFVLQNIFDL
jgi:hypothetical protein